MSKKKNKPGPRPITCSKCGTKNNFINTVPDIPPSETGQAPPIYCVKCRGDAARTIAQLRDTQQAATSTITTARYGEAQLQPDTRLERWLLTHNGAVRQNRTSPEDPWEDTPEDAWANTPEEEQVQPGPDQPDATCSTCNSEPGCYSTQMRNSRNYTITIHTCQVCTLLLMQDTQTIHQRANRPRTPWKTVLAPCPSCGLNPVQADRPSHPIGTCKTCLTATLQAINALVPRTTEQRRTDQAVYLTNPEGDCTRCSENGGDRTPAECLPCRIEYELMQQQAQPNKKGHKKTKPAECASCPSKTAVVNATVLPRTQSPQILKICGTCAQIARHHPIREKKLSAKPITIIECEGCGTPLTGPVRYPSTYNICHPCSETEDKAWETLTILYNHFRDVLETPQGGEKPEPPDEIIPWLRPGSLLPRPDAVEGKLTPNLSRELCREYVHELREIPELSIRFLVPIDSVINALTGETWAKHTKGLRPKALRPDPPRVRDPKPRETPKPRYMTVTRLKQQFGWTDRLITRYLGTHDQEGTNPHYKSAAPMRLFSIERTNDTQAKSPHIQQELQKNLDKRAKTQAASQANVLKQREQLLQETEAMLPIFTNLPHTNAGRLMEKATRQRRKFLEETLDYGYYNVPINDGGPADQARAVSMIRHEHTNYDDLLETMPRSTNAVTNTLIYLTVKTGVNNLIANTIPQLADACMTQIEEARKQATEALAMTYTGRSSYPHGEDGSSVLKWLSRTGENSNPQPAPDLEQA